MEFLIADTFTDSLAKLTGDEQKIAKTTAFDLQMNPVNPGMALHRIDNAKDKNFWSARVGRDIRLIVHKTKDSFLLCYVDHHDAAYDWATRRKLETHPKTGAAQLVEIRERLQEIVVPAYVEAQPAVAEKEKPFANLSDEALLSYGVPAEWIDDVRSADEDSVLTVSEHLPAEAAEALLELATGGKPKPRKVVAVEPFEHPDAKRRFRVISNFDELARALEYPWDKWTIFLHPAQQELIEKKYEGPARVAGSAGTGKTVVALHRAVYLTRKNPDARVLLATFSETLANALRMLLRRLISNEPRLGERIDVHSIPSIGIRLYQSRFGEPKLASRDDISQAIREAAEEVPDHKFRFRFLATEWDQIVDAWQLQSLNNYQNVSRLGRKTKIPKKQQTILWSIFQRVRDKLSARGLITESQLFTKLAAAIAGEKTPTFDFTVVDEAQDLTVAHLRFFAALSGNRPNSLFFAGDLGQRIFQQPFSWLELGVDIRGRSENLNVNYRTSHQIRTQADRLLAAEVSDLDGNLQDRSSTVSVFNGPDPEIQIVDNEEEETRAVSDWIAARTKEGVAPHEFGVFVRSAAQLARGRAAVERAAIPFKVLDEKAETTSGYASVATMHLAKGLEFRAVVVMACDDEVIPLQERIETVGDDADLQEVYDTERHLLYVACTRARDYLLVTATAPASEFLDDLQKGGER
jgi:superfamily I DNA/RNA helicase/mRNA-degrading endonuclease RelE of RelBE toxin-antitoxin system